MVSSTFSSELQLELITRFEQIRIRLFHVCHLVLRTPNLILPTIGQHGSPRAIIERYVQVEAGSDIALITESVFTAIKRMHHRLGIQDQRKLEKEMADLETVFEEASDKDRSFLRFEEIIRGNEQYAAFLVRTLINTLIPPLRSHYSYLMLPDSPAC